MVPVNSMIAMGISALAGLAIPVALAWWLVKKQKARLTTIVIGAGVFIVFALLLEPVLHQLVLKGPKGSVILGNVWLYALYGGLAAGFFEETGRFLAMKFLLQKEPSKALPAIAYGTGHGGVEMMLIFGVSMISNIVLSECVLAVSDAFHRSFGDDQYRCGRVTVGRRSCQCAGRGADSI